MITRRNLTTEHDAAFEAALPEPRYGPDTHVDEDEYGGAFTLDQMRAIWDARGEADARVCEALRDKWVSGAVALTFITPDDCATAIRGMK
jgi:hypothetical protein